MSHAFGDSPERDGEFREIAARPRASSTASASSIASPGIRA
jgi:hypothetical protein